jgi:hypothetical protein
MIHIAAIKPTTLKSSLSASASAVILASVEDRHGEAVSMSTFGEWGTVVIKNGTQWECIKFTALANNADGSTTLTVATSGRKILPVTPYTGGSTGFDFIAGSDVIFTNDGLTMSSFGNTENAQTWNEAQTYAVVPRTTGGDPVDNNDLVRKSYVLSVVLGSLTSIDVIVPGNAGETVAAGEGLYFDTTDNEWKRWDADTAASVNNVLLGIAQGAGTDGNPITDGILISGVDTHQTGLSVGDVQYASNTAGGISTTPGTNEVTVGIAKSATELYFSPRFDQTITENQQDAMNTTTAASASNLFMTQKDFQIGAETYAADAGANDTYAITLSPAPAAYVTGMRIALKANTANTGAASLNVNSLGAITIKKHKDVDLVTNDIKAGQHLLVEYDGTNFQLLSPVSTTVLGTSSSGATTKNLADASVTQNIAHGLGTTPTQYRVFAVSPVGGVAFAINTNTIANTDGSANPIGQATNTFRLHNGTASSYQTATVTADATNIILTWTKTGTPTGTSQIIWEASA